VLTIDGLSWRSRRRSLHDVPCCATPFQEKATWRIWKTFPDFDFSKDELLYLLDLP
jgi:hypothetical protein